MHARLAQQLGEGVVEGLERPPAPVQEGEPAGHHVAPRRHAGHRADVVAGRRSGPRRQPVEVRRRHLLAAVGREHVPVERVEEDEDGLHAFGSCVGRGGCAASRGRCRCRSTLSTVDAAPGTGRRRSGRRVEAVQLGRRGGAAPSRPRRSAPSTHVRRRGARRSPPRAARRGAPCRHRSDGGARGPRGGCRRHRTGAGRRGRGRAPPRGGSCRPPRRFPRKMLIAGEPMKLGDEAVGRPLVEFERRADLDDAAGVEHDDAVGHGHRLDLVVGDVDRGRAEPVVQRADLGAHLHAELGVEVRERLVEEEDAAAAARSRGPWPRAGAGRRTAPAACGRAARSMPRSRAASSTRGVDLGLAAGRES